MKKNIQSKLEIDKSVASIDALTRDIALMQEALFHKGDVAAAVNGASGDGGVAVARRCLEARGIDPELFRQEAFPTKGELVELGSSLYDQYHRGLKREFRDAKGCDAMDYSVAAFSGVLCGIIDVLWVGMPGESALGIGVDKLADKVVVGLSNLIARPRNKKTGRRVSKTDNIELAIKRLEVVFKVNYDQKDTTQVKRLLKLCPNSHHLLSLSHAPDWIGLIVSVINQFTSTSTFVSNGKVITIDTATFELYGKTVWAKLFCAVVNWFGHLVSDFNGSSSSIRVEGGHIGSGVCPPFYELTQLCGFGSIGEARQTIAEIAKQVFEWGYDFRHFLTCAIPVAVNELVVRFFWSLRQHFQYKKPVRQCLPTTHHPAVNRMLLVSYGCFCAVDAIDAGVRCGGEIITFLLRCNIVAWYRLAQTSVGEFRKSLEKERVMMEIHTDNIKKGTAELLEEYGMTIDDVTASLTRNGYGGYAG